MIRVRTYGNGEKVVILLHGGPAAPGYMALLAKELSHTFRVLEPLQRGAGEQPLSVAIHVEDLHEVITTMCADNKPVLVGHSWGAMLALAYAAEHSNQLASVILAGCGTFDKASRNRLVELRNQRMDDSFKAQLEWIEKELEEPDQRLAAQGKLSSRLDSYDLIPTEDETISCDMRAHEETWNDMMRLQEEGVYPAAFDSIDLPVIMLHGTFDIHPGQMIRDNLKKYIPHIEYHEWEHCGHYPWREKAVHKEFIRYLTKWLESHC